MLLSLLHIKRKRMRPATRIRSCVCAADACDAITHPSSCEPRQPVPQNIPRVLLHHVVPGELFGLLIAVLFMQEAVKVRSAGHSTCMDDK